MTEDKINALIASAFNLAAAEEPSIRRVHPNGMSPAIAAKLPHGVRLSWVRSYMQRISQLNPAEQKQRGHLFTSDDVFNALQTLQK